MMIYIFLTFLNLFLIKCSTSYRPATPYHEIVLHINDDVNVLTTAIDIAQRNNLKFIKKIFPNLNYYLFYKIPNEFVHNASYLRISRSIEVSVDVEKSLNAEPLVDWFEEQLPKKRVKRDDGVVKRKAEFNDPMWPKLWYINSKEKHSNLMRIKEAWQNGYTGKGIVITVLDDGLERDHPDLVKNFDFQASFDINDNDNDPKPRYDRYNYNKHGTRCAGEIAAAADNHVCSVGIAFNSKIGGIRMLDGDVTDLVEATALSYNRDYIDIYSASWGPDDDGKTVDGPGHLTLRALEDGVKLGRNGKGSIFVWASGNGGKDSDNCNCDGYTNSIYTISVSSATQHGNIPWYSESCSSTLATTYSSGSYNERQIVTTDLRKSCTEAHTGTSASAPIAAGIIALTLEANSNLTWRDIQHIIVQTSKQHNLISLDWQVNGVNKTVSHSFGFGLMDAMAMIDLAKKWQTVPSQRKCIIESNSTSFKKAKIMIPKGDHLVLELMSSGCKGSKNELNYLEHVQSVLSIQSSSRGGLSVHLTSPMGTTSTLLDIRELDQSSDSFNSWPFMTTHMWGESPNGKWILKIKNEAENTTFINWHLQLYGTKDTPFKRSVPRLSPNIGNLNMRNAKYKKTINSTNNSAQLTTTATATMTTDDLHRMKTSRSYLRDHLVIEFLNAKQNSGVKLKSNFLFTFIFSLFLIILK